MKAEEIRARLRNATPYREPVDLPDVDVTVYVRSMRGHDRELFCELATSDTPDRVIIQHAPDILMSVVVDEEGNQVFQCPEDVLDLEHGTMMKLLRKASEVALVGKRDEAKKA